MATALLAGCAADTSSLSSPQYLAAPTAAEKAPAAAEPSDPFEKQNRQTLENNQSLNKSVVYPLAEAYTENVPEPVRDGIENFTANLGEPAIAANQILQLRWKQAMMTTGRFIMNTTIGLGGIFDVASENNMPRQSGDFGQTLYVWGVRESPYLVLPVLGPTNVRDAVGNGIEMAATSFAPTGFLGVKVANAVNTANNVGTVLTPFTGLGKVGDLKELEGSSLDFYVMLKSVMEQKRQAELDQALTESAISPPSGPPEEYPEHDAIMTLHASPAFIPDIPKHADKAAAPNGTAGNTQAPATTITIGVPQIVVR